MKQKSIKQQWIITGAAVLLIATLAAGIIYVFDIQKRVYVDSSMISAPQIDLSPSVSGVLEDIYVQPGDSVEANQTVARVGNDLIQSKVAGIIISIDQKAGAQITPGQAVVSMIDPTLLRVIGKVDEDKGLSKIIVGDNVLFTVDAFGGKVYSGVIDEVSPTSEQSGIVFNISDQRAVQQFDVKARFNTSVYPELKNGMSARMWIYTE